MGNKTTSSTKIDPQLMALYNQNYSRAQGVANQPVPAYTGELASPVNSAQTTAGGILGNIAQNNPGSGLLASGANIADGVAGYNPSQVTAGQLSNTNLAPYMNPYTKDVINSSLEQLNQQRGQQRVSDNQAATAAHAFGGSRQGVADAITNQLYDQNAGSLISGLNADNFAQARAAAGTDIGNRLNASEFNTNAGITANGQRLSAAGVLGDLGQSQYNDASQAAQNLLGYGTQLQNSQNYSDQATYTDFLRKAGYPAQQQQILNQSLGIIPTPTTTTQKTSTGIGGILGGILGGAQTAGALGWAPFG